MTKLPQFDESAYYFYRKWELIDKIQPTNVSVCEESDGGGKSALLTKDVLVNVGHGKEYCDAGLIAFSKTCFRDAKGRPLSIFIGTCDAFYDPAFNKTDVINFLIHELHHSIGFDLESFLFFPKANCGNSSCVGYYSRLGVSNPLFMGTKARDYLRDFFNCTEIRGAELSQGSHLADRIFDEQLMRSIYIPGYSHIVDSKLVDFMMEASGWYRLRDVGKDSKFLYKIGCDGVYEDCKRYYKLSKDQRFYCFTNEVPCNVQKYSSPLKNPRFKNKYLGGYSAQEYCPITANYWNNQNTFKPVSYEKPKAVWEVYPPLVWLLKTFF